MDTLHLLETKKTCGLSPEDLARRIAWVRSEVLPYLRHEEKHGTDVVWELEDAPGLAATLDRWAGLEGECCSDLVFQRVPSARPGRLRLEIRAKRAATRWQRLGGLGGLGVGAALGVCCGLPLLAATLSSGAAGGGLAFGGASLLAGLLWWLRRRSRDPQGLRLPDTHQ